MQDELSKKLVMSLLSLTITCVVAFLSIAFCWFSFNKNVVGSNLKIDIAEQTGIEIKSYQVYKRDGAIDEAVKIADETTTDFSFHMTEYDSVFTDRNVNTPVVIRVELTGDGLLTTPTIKATVHAPSNTFLTDEKKLQNYASNILGINSDAIPALDDYDIDEEANEIYTGVVEQFTTGGVYDAQRFVTIKSTSPTTLEKICMMEFEISDYTLTSSDTLVVYFEFDYAPELIEEYMIEYGIDVKTSGTIDTIDFTADINFINFDFKEGAE